MATRKQRGTKKKWGGDKATRTALRHLLKTRKSFLRQDAWQAKFPLITQYYTAKNGLIYFEYTEQQFRKWEPIEPLNIRESNCVPSTISALRIRPHLRKLSRKCNRNNSGLIDDEDIPNMFGIPTSELRSFDDTNIKKALAGLPKNYATALGINFQTWSHICIVYRNEHGRLWIFEPQRIMSEKKRKRFPFSNRQIVYEGKPTSYELLYTQPSDNASVQYQPSGIEHDQPTVIEHDQPSGIEHDHPSASAQEQHNENDREPDGLRSQSASSTPIKGCVIS